MRILRGLGAVVVAVGLVVALPPTAAFALDDDLTCAQDATRQYTTHGPGGYETTVIGYCERWHWTPPSSTQRGEDGGDSRVGGAGAGNGGRPYTPPKVNCDQVKGQLAQAEELYGAYLAEYERARAAAGQATINFDNQGENADRLYEDLMRARADLGAWASVFRGLNQEDPFYYELSDAGSLEIARPVRLVATEGKAFGNEMIAVAAAYQRAVAAFAAAKGLYEYLSEVLTQEERAFATAEVNLTAALEEIELLQTILAKSCS